jgi:hypothetical protein
MAVSRSSMSRLDKGEVIAGEAKLSASRRRAILGEMAAEAHAPSQLLRFP